MHPQSTKLFELAERWSGAATAERANAQLYLTELADALDVERPRPAGSGFEFDFSMKVTGRDGRETSNFVDLFRREHFLLEAKQTSGSGSNEAAMRRAYGQALGYVAHVPGGPPPYVLVLDVGRSLLVWDNWRDRTYGGFQLARWIDLRTLADRPEDIDFLRAVWDDPRSLDPNRRAVAVTRDVAERLARLSASLEGRGHDPERVARFLIRCVFTMFAEDVELLRGEPFNMALQRFAAEPEEFKDAMVDLWKAMDVGGRFGMERLLRFNGHFFHDADVLPLTREDMVLLRDAAEKDWSAVEPTIFGTLLTRALDPVERHRLGAEYTPREYVERVVKQTVLVPIRERWSPVLAEVVQLKESGKKKDRDTALRRLRDFHAWMCGLRFLDPACGSGNFLYVTLHTVKRLELEVILEIASLTGNRELGLDEVGPRQFHGIEVKTWAREIAELTLWIGYHQFWRENHKGVNPPEPVLEDTGTLEQRDAVLAWDERVLVPEKSRPDPTPRIKSPVTGKLIPDPNARLPYYEYRGARQAEWPQADFIVGNPPYMGKGRQRLALGDGYVEALRDAYPELSDGVDFVVYWWYRAAKEIAARRTNRAGLITTNSITQTTNRGAIAKAIESGVRVLWAIPDHPWVDDVAGADVRVAMTVFAHQPTTAILVNVDHHGRLLSERRVLQLNADLTSSADVGSAVSTRLAANEKMSFHGFILIGGGFVLDAAEANAIKAADSRTSAIVHPYRNGRDLAARPREVSVIDFELQSEAEARQHPVLYDILRDRVKPQRDSNKRKPYRELWWKFGEPQRELRTALVGLHRYIVTPGTAKHRFFTFLDAEVRPDYSLVCVPSAAAFHLGVLSAKGHIQWALAAGGRLGVGNDPTYNNKDCFDPFPFPDPPKPLRDQIGAVAERLDKHRKDGIARDERVTMTGMYNVVEKLRSGAELTPKERDVHQIAACGVLRDLHDELDVLVAQAYGWHWPMEREEILERLVALHDERVEEERNGHIRWLRPDYQIPRFGRNGEGGAAPELALPAAEAAAPAEASARAWPASAVEQLAALQALVAHQPATPIEAAAHFTGARAELVRRHLETLAMVGEVRLRDDERYEAVAAPV